jgi:hypothetical protein
LHEPASGVGFAHFAGNPSESLEAGNGTVNHFEVSGFASAFLAGADIDQV